MRLERGMVLFITSLISGNRELLNLNILEGRVLHSSLPFLCLML